MASTHGGFDGLAGDLFLRLASDGLLAVEPAQAGQIMDDLLRTLDSVHLLLRHSEDTRPESAADWLIPGSRDSPPELNMPSLEAAQRELPKYIEAFRIVRDRRDGGFGPAGL
ncbi:hypothetical protein JOF53_006413 [Crossiella equi]|uniref:Uncharacterized protein n=1 Tax=Crossiella equi TaxID=130796 RepID=A0ABS5ALV6_9PSEU|nr:hypothetical protein [Crossiella equi]MBP2477541.1 hypothetical protein [Crossiella equi]